EKARIVLGQAPKSEVDDGTDHGKPGVAAADRAEFRPLPDARNRDARRHAARAAAFPLPPPQTRSCERLARDDRGHADARPAGRSGVVVVAPVLTRSVRATRRFGASPERVFAAWLDPTLVRRWLFATATRPLDKFEIDARIGGRLRIVDNARGVDYRGTCL